MFGGLCNAKKAQERLSIRERAPLERKDEKDRGHRCEPGASTANEADNFDFFSLALVESCDVRDTAQLLKFHFQGIVI